jgi:hypothetical protein
VLLPVMPAQAGIQGFYFLPVAQKPTLESLAGAVRA